MNRIQTLLAARRHPISLAFALLLGTAAGGALAQTSTVTGSVTTDGTLNGNLQQTQQGPGIDGAQVAAIGAVRQATVSGKLSTQGAVHGSLTQVQNGSDNSATAGQQVAVGSASGRVSVSTVGTQGTVRLGVTQQRDARAGGGVTGGQVLDVASVNEVQGGSLSTRGNVLGRSGASDALSQTSRGAGTQRVAVGSANGSNIQAANTDAFAQAAITQTLNVAGRGGDQSLGVARIEGGRANDVRARGTVFGAVTQQQAAQGIAGQTVEVGSVINAASAGNLRTEARLEGSLTQVANSSRLAQGSLSQDVSLGRIAGGSHGTATTDASFRGNIRQTQSELASQRIALADVAGGSGTARTSAQVFGDLIQSAGFASGGSGIVGQRIELGTSVNNQGTVTTAVFSLGNVRQSSTAAGGSNQRVDMASVEGAGAGTVTTRATVSGDINQDVSSATGNQTVLVGSVGR